MCFCDFSSHANSAEPRPFQRPISQSNDLGMRSTSVSHSNRPLSPNALAEPSSFPVLPTTDHVNRVVVTPPVTRQPLLASPRILNVGVLKDAAHDIAQRRADRPTVIPANTDEEVFFDASCQPIPCFIHLISLFSGHCRSPSRCSFNGPRKDIGAHHPSPPL